MNRETKVFILLLLFSTANCFGQQLSMQVLVPAAGVTTAGVITYSQSIGETAVELMTSPDVVLTQGFQQPHFEVIEGQIPQGNGVNVYPNPASDYIYVSLFGDTARKFKIELINLTGLLLDSWSLEFSSKFNYVMPIEATKLKFGIYLVRVVSSDRVISRVFKIEKM